MDFKGKVVTVIGAAKSGQSAARLLRKLHASVQISEGASAKIVAGPFRSWAEKNKIVFEFNGHTKAFVQKSDLIILSPGVRIDAQPVQWARQKNIPVWGEIELGARLCTKPIIAVTGSNGKTTVSTLIARLINASGKKACLCGNVGNPFTGFALKSAAYDYFVIEISSFQLETIETFKPHVAVFLNFSQNHLDRHADIQEYFDAKKRIFLNQDKKDFAVLNAHDPWVKKVASKLRAQVRFFNQKASANANPNHLAVLEVVKILKLPIAKCREELAAFGGVEHRMEKVRNLDGVEYINDSKATTVEAGRWALQSLSRPVVMICGGRDKHLDYSVLRPLVKCKVKKMIVFGEAKGILREAFKKAVDIEECATLEESVTTARLAAKSGEVVLLSPMCTSYDMFKNFEHRGRTFKSIVKNLK